MIYTVSKNPSLQLRKIVGGIKGSSVIVINFAPEEANGVGLWKFVSNKNESGRILLIPLKKRIIWVGDWMHKIQLFLDKVLKLNNNDDDNNNSAVII